MDAGRHPLIEVITNAEITGCEGGPGDFTVTVRKNPRYVKTSASPAASASITARRSAATSSTWV